MATLGDILGAAYRSAAGLQRWVTAADPELAETLARMGTKTGQSSAVIARSAVADFSNFATEEDWAQLVRIMSDHPDPGRACLAAMVNWRIHAAHCARHGAGPAEESTA